MWEVQREEAEDVVVMSRTQAHTEARADVLRHKSQALHVRVMHFSGLGILGWETVLGARAT